jgi:hypothetical protein
MLVRTSLRALASTNHFLRIQENCIAFVKALLPSMHSGLHTAKKSSQSQGRRARRIACALSFPTYISWATRLRAVPRLHAVRELSVRVADLAVKEAQVLPNSLLRRLRVCHKDLDDVAQVCELVYVRADAGLATWEHIGGGMRACCASQHRDGRDPRAFSADLTLEGVGQVARPRTPM